MKKTFVNGCFDILHRGHIELFKYARSLSDYLVVAIDSDKRIKEHKGVGRPFNCLEDRKFVLESIKFIDKVISFDNDKELEIAVKNTNPEFMIVGSDWKDKTVIGGKFANKIMFFERIDEYSTTETIQSIGNR